MALSAVPFFKSCLFTSCSYRVYAQSADLCMLWRVVMTFGSNFERGKKKKKEKKRKKKYNKRKMKRGFNNRQSLILN